MKNILLIVILVILGAVVWFFTQGSGDNTHAIHKNGLHVLRQQTLVIATVEKGYLQAVKSHAITASRGKIEWVIKEGAEVQEGDKILELDATQITERIKNYDTNIDSTEKELALKKGGLNTEKDIAQSWIDDAIIKHEQAQEALKKYRNIDGLKNMKKYDSTVEDNEDKLIQTQADITKKQTELDDSAFVDASVRTRLEKEYKNLHKKMKTQRTQLSTSINDRSTYKSKTYPEELSKLTRTLERVNLDVDRARARAEQSIVSFHSKMENLQTKIDRAKKRLKDEKERLKHCIIRAPAPGFVIYGDPKSDYQYRIRQQLKAGGQTWSNYTLMTIPDMSKFSLQVSISEHARGRVGVGSRAEIEIPAIPGLKLTGALTHVSQLAKFRQADNPSSPKVYTGTVELNEHDSRMVSGMTAKVTLIGEVIEDVLSIPIEAVFSEENKRFCYVWKHNTFEQRVIELGAINEFYAQVTSGLQAGESVCLFEPATDL